MLRVFVDGSFDADDPYGESIVADGKDLPTATKNALDVWIKGGLPVIQSIAENNYKLVTLFGHTSRGIIEEFRQETRVYLGPVVDRGSPSADAEKIVKNGLFGLVGDSLDSRSFRNGQALQIYVLNKAGRMEFSEQEKLKDLDWPETDERYSFRQFCYLIPND